jgi:hypothetical protein
MRTRWRRRVGAVVLLSSIAWTLEVVLAGAQIRGTMIVMLAAMTLLTTLALGLRARSLRSP